MRILGAVLAAALLSACGLGPARGIDPPQLVLAPDCADLEPPEPAATVDFEDQQAALDAVEDVRAYARQEAADTYGGLWLDQPEGVLTVAFTAEADRHETALRERLGNDVDLAVVTVEHSYRELEAVRERIDLGAPVGQATLVGHGIRDELNRVELMVAAVDEQARRLLSERLGGEHLCVRPLDGPPRGTPPGGGAEGVVAIPTTAPGPSMASLLDGVTLAGDPGLDGGCVWVEGAGRRVTVVWPAGYGARFTPAGVELVDASGAVVAREGDILALGGGEVSDLPDRCRVGDQPIAWVAGSVEVQ